MKKMIFFLLSFSAVAGPLISQIPTPVPGWPKRSDTEQFATWTPGRFADENLEKYLYFSTARAGLLKFNLDGSFPVGWPYNCDSILFESDPVILDIDHDGRFEFLTDGMRIINGRYAYSLLFLIDDDGVVMPGFPIQVWDPIGLAAADMDNDNEYEILYYSWNVGPISCLDRYGNPETGWPIPLPYDIIYLGGSIGDLDLDGANEFVLPGYRNIYAFKFDGTMMEGFPIALEDTNFIFMNGNWPNALADFDGNGYIEIIAGGTNYVYEPSPNPLSFVAVYDHTGQLQPGWPHYFPEDLIVSSITPADIDDNGTIEVGFQSYNLHFLDPSGAEIPPWPVMLTLPDGSIRATYADLSMVDLDGDGDREIFTDFNILYPDSLGHDSLWYLGYSYLFAIDHFGQSLSGYPVIIRGVPFLKPPTFSLGELDNRLYMSLVSEIWAPDYPWDSVFLQLYQFPDSTGPTDQWPMLSHDNLHTRNYNFVDRVTSLEDDDVEILPKSPILKQNYPNPFNLATMIEFTLPKEQQISLSIFDVLGRKVVNIYDEVLTQGTHRYHLNLDMPSGIYLCRLKTETTSITRKMALVK